MERTDSMALELWKRFRAEGYHALVINLGGGSGLDLDCIVVTGDRAEDVRRANLSDLVKEGRLDDTEGVVFVSQRGRNGRLVVPDLNKWDEDSLADY